MELLSYSTLLSISWIIVKVFGILILGYFLGRITKVLVKFLLKKVIGIDKWLDMKGVKVFNGDFSEIIAVIAKDFIYLIFFAYALIYSDIGILIRLGDMFLLVLFYISIILIVMIMVHLLLKVFLEDVINKLLLVGNNAVLTRVISILVYMIALIITLDYMNLLSRSLLYIFLIAFGGFVIFLSVTFGIAYGEKIKEMLKK